MPIATAYAKRQPPAERVQDPVTVLVTGFGPFLERFPRNSSWELASTLPALIPASPDNRVPIRVYVHHEPIRVAYKHVVDLVPALLPPANRVFPRPDIVLHIGLAAGRHYFTLEQGAHRIGYDKIPDVDGERFPNAEAEREFPATEFPPVLTTSFDTADVHARWRAHLGRDEAGSGGDEPSPITADVRVNPDAGNFLCGFLYYNTLAHYHAAAEDARPVAFMHTPDLSYSKEKTRAGREVTVALIKALVESRREVGVAEGAKKAGDGEGERHREEGGMDVNFV